MKKAKIEIKTTVDGEQVIEKYISKIDDNTITYTDKQKTTTTIEYDENKMNVKRSGFVNYELTHDGVSKVESEFKTLVEGQAFEMVLKIENKSYNIDKCGKILSIETQFLREDNSVVKQLFTVEEK